MNPTKPAHPYSEDDLLPLSRLSELIYCERRAALVLLEGAWSENVHTIEGRLLHQRVHEHEGESRGDVRIARGLALRSLRLGLSGKADVVEFHLVGGASLPRDEAPSTEPRATSTGGASSCKPQASTLPAPQPRTPNTEQRSWTPFPVEYKRGRPKPDHSDLVQLCAQALCLEEMLRVPVPAGALFYGTTRRRLDVAFTPELRAETEDAARRLHALFAAGITPKAVPGPKCPNCSLHNICMPSVAARQSVARYLECALSDAGGPAP